MRDDCALLDQGAAREDVLLLRRHGADVYRLLPEQGGVGAVDHAHGGEGHRLDRDLEVEVVPHDVADLVACARCIGRCEDLITLCS